MLRILKRVKSTGWFLIALMFWLYGGGRINADNYAASDKHAVPISNLESRFDALLSELKDVLIREGAKTKSGSEKGFQGIRKVVELRDSLVEENEKARNYFSQIERLIKEKKLAGEILNRHQEMVRDYEAKYKLLIENIEVIESAHDDANGLWAKLTGKSKKVDWDGLIGKALTFLEENTPPARESHFDPKSLPHRSLKADRAIAPKLTREEWARALSTDGEKTISQSSAAKSKSPSILATAPPTSADLAETIEVKFTPEIRQLADSLGRNPVRIFNWVRNNIEFVPTWGSIQGAELCLENRAGNAFDTASLLIALLRYSGIAARYQMGTIEVPVEKFKNWAGGFTSTEAAASLFASAGVPSVVRRANQNGQVVAVRLEHVWVKALVDYAPSGGAVHRQGDAWVEMDPGFKQYSFVQGADLEAAAPLNAAPFLTQLASTATIDPATNSVTGFNLPAFQSFLQQNSQQRISHLRTNFLNATVREAMGGKAISAQSLALLPSRLPYRILARATELSQIPDTLRHKVTFGLGANPQIPGSTDLFNYTASLPELAGKNILLLYRLASQADDQLLAQPQISRPATINLVPQLYVGDQLVAAGHALRVGGPVVSQITFSSPTISTPAVSNTMIAGETAAIGLDLQRVSPSQIQEMRQKTQNISGRIQQQDIQNLTSRDFAEALLSNAITSWFAVTDVANERMAQGSSAVSLRYPSAGMFFVKLNVASLFGAPVSFSADGFNMDIDRDIVVNLARDGDAQKAARLTYSQGNYGSAMEAQIPISLMTAPSNPVSGVATMQAFNLANNQAIPIHQINSSNASTILPLLQIDSGELTDIQDAINAGLEVTVARRPVSFNGRTILGTVIKDPASGSASFLVSGGTNGALIGMQNILLMDGLMRSLYPSTTSSNFLEFILQTLQLVVALLATIVIGLGQIFSLLIALVSGWDSVLFQLPDCIAIAAVLIGIMVIIAIIATPALLAALVAEGADALIAELVVGNVASSVIGLPSFATVLSFLGGDCD